MRTPFNNSDGGAVVRSSKRLGIPFRRDTSQFFQVYLSGIIAILLFGLARANESSLNPVSIISDRFSLTTVYLGTSLVVVSVWQKLILWHCRRAGFLAVSRPQSRHDIFRSFIGSKLLLHSLSCSCFAAAKRRRLNGFQNRCVRQILSIPPAFISRVSTAEVLRRAQPQICYGNTVQRCPRDHVMRQTALIPGTL